MNRFLVMAFALALPTLVFSLTAHAVEAVVPPMSAARKAASGVPKLIPADMVKTFVNGLGGEVRSADKTATLRGRIPNACVPYLTLQSTDHVSEGGTIPFALMGTAQAMDCLKTNVSKCLKADSKDCSSFEKLAKDPKTAPKFHPVVSLDDADPSKLKVTLAKSAMVMNDKTVKLEATADCCDVNSAGSAVQMGDEQPMKKVALANLADAAAAVNRDAEIPSIANRPMTTQEQDEEARKVAAATLQDAKAKQELEEKEKTEKKKKPDPDDEDDEDKKDDPEAKRNAARDPMLARVPTDKDMELATAKNMEEYYKQYYSNLMQSQMFQMNMQYQNQMFQMKNQLSAMQQQQQGMSSANNWLTNYAPMQSLGTVNGFSSVPSMANGYWPTFTLPPLGSSSTLPTSNFGR